MEKKKPAQVFHFDLYGKREDKYDFLNENSMKTIAWQTLQPQEPELFFVPKDFEVKEEYDKGCKMDELFNKNSSGIATARDSFTIKNSIDEIKEIINDFVVLDDEVARIKYNLREDVRDWKVSLAKEDVLKNYKDDSKYVKILYRPFDIKYTFYTGKSKGFHCMPRGEIMNNFLNKDNIGYIFPRQCKGESGFNHGFISKNIIDVASGDAHSGSGTNFFPLYLYTDKTTQQTTLSEFETLTGLNGRVPNLNMEIVNQMAKGLGLPFVAEKDLTGFQNLSGLKNFAPIDILDYIYAVLHSPSYREKYKEFLKIDFPRVPYPHHVGTDRNVRTGRDLSVLEIQKYFWQLVALGGALRQIHLLESEVIDKLITQYPEDGDNVVVKPIYKEGNVFINETQYFANVPEVAWDFYIGGYQPAQKWLKDRKDRELSYEDILHYQKIIVALTETDKLMKEIDKITL